MKIKTLGVVAFTFLISSVKTSNAQFSIQNADGIPDVKTSTTYIPMNDTSSAIAAKFKDVFRKYWKFSKIKFINYKDIGNYITETSSFFTFEGEVITQVMNGMTNTYTHIYYELWLPDQKFFKKQRTEFKDKWKVPIARVYMYPDFETEMKPESIYEMDYDCGGHVYNWSPGCLKSYLQILQSFLEDGKNFKPYSGGQDDEEIKKLRNQTLLVPKYAIAKFNAFNGKSKDRDEEDVMSDYKYKYQVLPFDDMDALILDDSKPVYYMLYIRSSTDKFVIVINSKTGGLIYSDYTPASHNLKAKDLRRIYDHAHDVK